MTTTAEVPGLSVGDFSDPTAAGQHLSDFAAHTSPRCVRALARTYRETDPQIREWARNAALSAVGAGQARGTTFLPFSERVPGALQRISEALDRRTLREEDIRQGFLTFADAILAADTAGSLSERQLVILLAPVARLYPSLISLAQPRAEVSRAA